MIPDLPSMTAGSTPFSAVWMSTTAGSTPFSAAWMSTTAGSTSTPVKLNELISVVNGHSSKLDELAAVVNAYDRKFADLSTDLAGLRETLTHYHASVLCHGILISDLEERVRRTGPHLHLKPASG